MSSDNPGQTAMPQSSRPPTDLTALLRSVSRSFYLSIRLLPAALRRPIAAGYLLARATDTIADTAELASAQRLEMLQTLAAAIDGEHAADVALPGLAEFTAQQTDRHERELMQQLQPCLQLLEGLAPADRDDVRAVLRHITRGQTLDVERFASGSGMRALDTPDQLREYTYLVAGCVGEFWTDLCFRHVPNFASRPASEMRLLGRDYGMALQLVNIVRDAGADLAQGRCYFPASELAQVSIAPDQITTHPDRFEAIRKRWEEQARHGLEQGMRYVDAVTNRRVRAASALPALLGARTLALMHAAGREGLKRKVKMPRVEVRSILMRLAITFANRASLHAQFARLGAAPVSSQWDNRGQ